MVVAQERIEEIDEVFVIEIFEYIDFIENEILFGLFGQVYVLYCDSRVVRTVNCDENNTCKRNIVALEIETCSSSVWLR